MGNTIARIVPRIVCSPAKSGKSPTWRRSLEMRTVIYWTLNGMLLQLSGAYTYVLLQGGDEQVSHILEELVASLIEAMQTLDADGEASILPGMYNGEPPEA